MIEINNISTENLFAIAEIATGNYFSSQFSIGQKEIETGGYGRRRLVEWEYDAEIHYFEIDGESKTDGWHWYAWCITKLGMKENIHCLNPALIVDYCDKHDINVRNKPYYEH